MSEWISVDDRLPESYKVVSLCGGDVEYILGVSTAGFYSPTYCCFEAILESDGLELCTATHWMPLPQPPEEVE